MCVDGDGNAMREERAIAKAPVQHAPPAIAEIVTYQDLALERSGDSDSVVPVRTRSHRWNG